jgi:hypothetical protein
VCRRRVRAGIRGCGVRPRRLHGAPLERVPAKSASFPKATHRCHSVRDSQDPASFFQDVLVASEKIAMLVALAAFLSASLPMKPIRVILLRYIRFSCSARLSRAPESEWARLPSPEAAFLGGPERGSQNRKGARAKQKLRRRRAPQKPRSSAETNGWGRERDRTEHHAGGGSSRRNCAIQTIANWRALYWKSTPTVSQW